MSSIKLVNTSVEFPVFNANGRSLTSRILEVATGGKLDSDPQGKVLVKALDRLNLEVESGDKLGIVGHNGSGKSTLLRAISGIYKPTSGSLETLGNVGSLIDISLGINAEATGRENVFIRGALLGLPKKLLIEKFDEIVDFAELGDFIELPVRTYSTGMQLRLAFAVSTIISPEILVMDEWLSVGDENFRDKAERRLSRILENARILVLATHSRELLENTCNRAIWLDHGQILMDSDPHTVAEKYFRR